MSAWIVIWKAKYVSDLYVRYWEILQLCELQMFDLFISQNEILKTLKVLDLDLHIHNAFSFSTVQEGWSFMIPFLYWFLSFLWRFWIEWWWGMWGELMSQAFKSVMTSNIFLISYLLFVDIWQSYYFLQSKCWTFPVYHMFLCAFK